MKMITVSKGAARTLLGAFVALALAVVLAPAAAFAASINTGTACSLTLAEVPTLTGGATFNVYKVADVSADGAYTLAGDFAGHGGDIDLASLSKAGTTASDWRAGAAAAAKVVSANGIKATKTLGVSAASGTLSGLSTGLYLVSCPGGTDAAGNTYTFEDFLVQLPMTGADGAWVYDVTATVKYEKATKPEQPNKPEQPTTPKENMPKTGDTNLPAYVVAGVAVLGAAAAGAGIYLRRKNK